MPKNQRIYIRVSKKMKEDLEQFARLEGTSLSEYLIVCAYNRANKIFKVSELKGKNDKKFRIV